MSPPIRTGSLAEVFSRTRRRWPLVLDRPPKTKSFWKDNHPLVTMPDDALIGAMESDGAIWLYGSESAGMTWQYLSLIAVETPQAGKPCCAGLILLPNGRLQCYLLMVRGESSTLCLGESADGFRWTQPHPVAADVDSPWPLRLRDGRVVVIFARRRPPAGIAALVSTDDGRTWSAPAMIRDAGGGPDVGDPVAAELAAGRIFTAYAWPRREGDQRDGPCLLGRSLFELR